MPDEIRVAVVIPAAGQGTRMRADRPKQFMEIDGKPILLWAIEPFQQSSAVDSIVLAVAESDRRTVEQMVVRRSISKVSDIVSGGAERQHSVWNALQALRDRSPEIVLVHDAVRPFVYGRMITDLLEMLRQQDAAILAVRSKDTIKMATQDLRVESTPDRNRCWMVQTPQGFRFEVLYRAFEDAVTHNVLGTDEATLVERMGTQVYIIEGSSDNIKVTTAEDLDLAQLIARRRSKVI